MRVVLKATAVGLIKDALVPRPAGNEEHVASVYRILPRASDGEETQRKYIACAGDKYINVNLEQCRSRVILHRCSWRTRPEGLEGGRTVLCPFTVCSPPPAVLIEIDLFSGNFTQPGEVKSPGSVQNPFFFSPAQGGFCTSLWAG